MTRLSRRPIRQQLRTMVALLLVFVAVVAGSSLASVLSQSRSVRLLTLSLGPAQDASVDVLQTMTEANAQLGLAMAGEVVSRPVGTYRTPVDERLQHLRTSLAFDGLPDSDRRTW